MKRPAILFTVLLLLVGGAALATESTVVDSVAIGAADNVSTLTTGSLTCSGSNRVLYALVGNAAGVPVDPSSVKWGGSGGVALTKVSTTLDVTVFGKTSLWRLIAPSAATNTVYADWGTNQDERWVIGVCLQDADQTTPNGTIATGTGTSNPVSTSAASTSGQIVVNFISVVDTGAGSATIAVTSGQAGLENLGGGTAISPYEGAGASTKTAAGASTATGWTITGVSGLEDWGQFAFAVIGASGGGSSVVPHIIQQSAVNDETYDQFRLAAAMGK